MSALNRTTSQDWSCFWSSTKYSRMRKSKSKERILRVLSSYIEPGLSVLDAGCGSGFFSARFIALGARVTAVDYSEEALRFARRNTGDLAGEYLLADLRDADFAGTLRDRFDLVFSDGLFEHFPPAEQDAILANFVTMTKPGGIVATFVPNLFHPRVLVQPIIMPGIREKPFTRRRLLDFYRRNGLRAVESGGVNCVPIEASPDRALGAWFGMIIYAIGQAV